MGGLCEGEFLFGTDFSPILFQSFNKKGTKWTHCHHTTICLRATPLTETENRDVEGSSISELEEWRVINCSRLLVDVHTTFLDTSIGKLSCWDYLDSSTQARCRIGDGLLVQWSWAIFRIRIYYTFSIQILFIYMFLIYIYVSLGTSLFLYYL